MVPEYLSDILKKLGWTDGFQVPIANDENKKLEAEVAKLTLQRLQSKIDYENSLQRYNALERHLKFVTHENEETQKLISVHKQQLDQENHILKITKAEKEKLAFDLKESVKKIKNGTENNNDKRAEINKKLSKIEKLKKETFWDEEALKAWEESLKKRQDDNALLEQFTKEDEKLFLELEAKRASLQTEYLDRQVTVEKMVNDLLNYETVLERTGKTIKKLVCERDALIRQWKDTVNMLNQRDNDISKMQDQLIELLQQIQKDQTILDDEKRLYQIEIDNNKEIERENSDLNNQHSHYMRDLDKITQYLLLLNSELNAHKREMIKIANNLENERCRRKNLLKTIELKEDEIEKTSKKLEKLENRYSQLALSNESAEERCKTLEKLIDFEQKQNQAFLSECDRLSASIFRVQTKLANQLEITKQREIQIANTINYVEYLRKTKKESQNTCDKKREEIYNMEFKIDQLEEKINKLEGQKLTDEEDQELMSKLRVLEKELAKESETKNLLTEQITRIQDEMRRLTSAITNDEEKLLNLRNKLQDQKLDYEGGLKQLENVKSEAQEKQVEENMLILKLKGFEKNMKKEENEIYNLQKMKLNLEQAMRERDLEIKAKRELLIIQKRSLEEDKGRLKNDMSARSIKAKQLQQKYNIVLLSLGTDNEGQTLSVTHFKLKAAQDKYILKQRGDELDNQIKTTESEIVAMENTLKVLNVTNEAFKKSLSVVQDQDREMDIMKSLQNKYYAVSDELRNIKKILANGKQEIKDIHAEMETLNDQREEFKKSLGQLEIECNKIQKENNDKQEKVKRTNNLINKMEKKLSQDTKLKYDRDLEIKQLIDINRNALQKICEIAITYSEVNPSLQQLAFEYNIKLPDMKTVISRLSDSSYSPKSSETTSLSERKSSSSSTILPITEIKSRGSCHCSSTSSSMASVVLSFD